MLNESYLGIVQKRKEKPERINRKRNHPADKISSGRDEEPKLKRAENFIRIYQMNQFSVEPIFQFVIAPNADIACVRHVQRNKMVF